MREILRNRKWQLLSLVLVIALIISISFNIYQSFNAFNDSSNGNSPSNGDSNEPSATDIYISIACLNGSYLRGIVDIMCDVFGTNITLVRLSIDENNVWIRGAQSIKYEWDTVPFKDGLHKIGVLAMDNVGNIVEQHVFVIVDNTTPSISIINPVNGSTLSDKVEIMFTSSDLYFDKVTLLLDENKLIPLPIFIKSWNQTGIQTYEWDTSTAANGSYTIEVIAIDKAGNKFKASINVFIKNTLD